MGFLKKIFKPVSRVLDKIIPNEIKPALPFAAAFAPYLLPTGIMGAGVAQRALMGGGLNIFGQLAQEGNEGDINLLSAGLGALSGAMTAPGGTVGEKVISPGGSDIFKVPGKNVGGFRDLTAKGIERFGAESAGGQILTGLDKASKFMTDPGLTKFTAPVAQATGDLMFAQAKRDQDEYDRMMEEEAENEYASNASRALAIRQSMEAYGFSDDEIEDAIAAAGYAYGGRVGLMNGGGDFDEDEYLKRIKEEDKKSEEDEDYIRKIIDPEEMAKGGRVGLEFGGIPAALENIEDDEMKDTAKFVSAMDDMDVPIMDLVEEFEIQFKRKPNSLEELKEFYKDRYDYKGPADVKIKETMEESFREKAAEGGLMNLGGKEMDLRGGGFVPIGKKEKADDVPARLSKNEFVMTADAVRAAGGGSVNEGAKRMYKVMNDLEARA